ncbi:hypothetical protein ILUMI_09495 [Ignelater luminosus]|uniref:S1 motif domain-containing protein n=1 Tax=Ignelater luminosus TaxID=2038154 RepID=A0A8K0D921_IGNLU|nr:hypothetical protein ILUMI_09495 [Ignelater luminosus]
MDIEVNFPRGGIKPTKVASRSPNKNKQKGNQTPSLKRKRSNSEDDTVVDNDLYATAADAINYKKLQEDMLLLGCLRDISSFTLELELPGKTSGKVNIASISEPYTKLLQREVDDDDVVEDKDISRLNEMFQIGQFLPTKIMEKKEGSNKTSINLSIDPKDINSEWKHHIFKERMLVWAAVASKLDHGYQLDAGISGSRIFLPFDNVEEGTSLVIGQPLWCIITRCEVSSTASTATVSILREHLIETTQNNNINQHYLIPGMQLNFTISKAVNYGLQGKFLNQCVGYINDNYLATPLEKSSKYKEGQTVKAWLLYVQPTTRWSYFSLRSVWDISTRKHELGLILRGQVLSRAAGGINVKFPNNEKGFMPYKRIMHVLGKNDALNLNDAINKKLPPGSSHKFRILDYNHMEQVYMCTCEQSVLNENYFTVNDIKIGELVTVKVDNITRGGLQVLLGNVKCFIHNTHLSDSPYTENIKKKFFKGQKLKTRVWSIDDRGVYLTNKQKLVNSDLCLAEVDKAVINQQYPGVVVNKSERGILVVFYNNIKGFLPRRDLIKVFHNDTNNMFYVGEVIMPTIKSITSSDLRLTLSKPVSNKTVEVGSYVEAKVTAIHEYGLEVEVNSNKLQALIPTAHLSSSLSLTSSLLKTYHVGDNIKDLLCLSNRQTPVLSLREGKVFRKQNLKFLRYKDLEEGKLIRCLYEDSDKSGIYVTAPLIPHGVTFKIPNEELVQKKNELTKLNFKSQQAIVAKVIKLDKKNKIQATAKVSEVFDFNLEYSLDLLEQYLQDQEQIKTHLLEIGSPIADLQLGQHVECVISQMTDVGCCLSLPNGMKGFAYLENRDKFKVDQKVEGIVFWINYHQEVAEVSISNKIDEIKDDVIDKPFGSTVYGDVISIHSEYVIVAARNQDGSRQVVFVPFKLHENNFTPYMDFDMFKKVKVVIYRKVSGKLIGLEKRYIHKLNKSRKEKRKANGDIGNQKKRKRLEVKRNNVCVNKNDHEMSEESDEENLTGDDTLSKSETDKDENQKQNNVRTDSSDDDDHDDSGNKGSDVSSDSETDGDEDQSNIRNNSNTTIAHPVLPGVQNYFSTSTDQSSELINDNNRMTVCPILPGIQNYFFNSSNQSSELINDNNQMTVRPVLPGVQNYFSNSANQSSDDESSGDETSKVETNEKKKKKPTVAERKELARLEEEELIRKEIENADSVAEPKTEEQFLKLIKGKPNNSKIWVLYMAHLASSAELEKTRIVAEDALRTINLELTAERLNIWIALLSFECMYGEQTFFDEAFERAVKCNDPLKIYLSVITVLAEVNKFDDMEKMVLKAKRKFKQDLKMWLDIGRVYYKHKQIQKARSFKDAALLTFTKRQCVTLLVQYAIMEFEYGEKAHAEALFETVLQNEPKRVDIWCTYVDQVIKKADIDTARNILEKSVSQDIPAKKLKVLFKKYIDFEKAHGTPEQLEHVMQLAKNYVNK